MPKDERNTKAHPNRRVRSGHISFDFRVSTFVIRILASSFPEPFLFLLAAERIAAPSRRAGQSRHPGRGDADVDPANDQMQQPGKQKSDKIESIKTIEKNCAAHQQTPRQL